MNKVTRLRSRARTNVHAYNVAFDGNSVVTVNVRDELVQFPTRVSINDLPILNAFHASLPSICADFIELASAVYVADRLCKRGTTPGSWPRNISVSLPVRRVPDWEARATLLTRVLQQLTGDNWTFVFTKRTTELRSSEAQTVLFPSSLNQPSNSILFSGGLDSLAGLVRQQQESWNELIAISVITNKRIASIQNACLGAVQRAFPRKIHGVAIRVSLTRTKNATHAFDGEERSQRSRGFLFQAMGAITAHVAGLDALIVPENGVGAINLPYIESQVSTQAGRAANPINLRLMSEFCSSVFARPFSIQLPHRLETKGELLGALRGAHVADAIATSVSCDKFPQRIRYTAQCGRCTSCLLRRQSLFQAGLAEFDLNDSYVFNLMERECDTDAPRWYQFRAMTDQVERLDSAINSASPERELIDSFPALAEQFMLCRLDAQGASVLQLIDLYRRYCAEWKIFHSTVLESQLAISRQHA